MIKLFSNLLFKNNFSQTCNKKQYFSNLSQSFKQKNKLNEFFKHVHPDILGNAPERVREENTRSLKSLNSYLDSVSQNSGVQELNLKFYCPEKTDKPSKKFFFFQVRLTKLDSNSPQNLRDEHMDNITTTLIDSIKQTQERINPFFKKLQENDKNEGGTSIYQFDPEKSFQKIQYDIQPLGIKKRHNAATQQGYQDIQNTYDLFTSVIKERNKDIIDAIDKQLYFIDTPCNKPLMWSRIIIKDSDFYSKMFNIFSKLIDPRLIFIDSILNEQQIEIFKQMFTFSKDKQFHKDMQIMGQVFQDMENENPQICLYVSESYGSNSIPGFFSIPYNFKVKEMEEQYSNLKSTIITNRRNYTIMTDKKDKLKLKLIQSFNLKGINLPFPKNQEEVQNQIIFLKKIQRIMEDNEIVLNSLKNKTIHMSEKIDIQARDIKVPFNFSLNDIQQKL